MRKVIIALIALAIIVSLGFVIFQLYNPTIQGKVLDENGSPVQGAQVKISDRSIITDNSGNFTIRIHKAKEIDIQVSKEGYITLKQTIPFENISNNFKLTLLRATKFNLIKEKGILTIGASKNHLRQYGRDSYTPDLSVDIEIWKLITRRLGVKLDVKFYKDIELVNVLKNREVDLILSNEQFLKNSGLLIGTPYYDTSQVACVKVENKSIRTASDLKGKKIGIAKNSQAGIEAVKSIGGKPVFYDTYTWAMALDLKPFKPIRVPIQIDKPIKDEIDASLFDKFVTEYNGIFTDRYKLIDIEANHDDFVFAGLSEDKETVDRINNILIDSYKYDKTQYRDIADGCFWMYME